MKKHLFTFFILSLGFFTAYVFYALWQSQASTSTTEHHKTEKKTPENLTNKVVTPQTTYSVKKTKPTSATKPIKQEKIIFKTAKMLEKETEEVYESLRPTQHQALVDESAEAFEKLDEKVENMELLEKK